MRYWTMASPFLLMYIGRRWERNGRYWTDTPSRWSVQCRQPRRSDGQGSPLSRAGEGPIDRAVPSTEREVGDRRLRPAAVTRTG